MLIWKMYSYFGTYFADCSRKLCPARIWRNPWNHSCQMSSLFSRHNRMPYFRRQFWTQSFEKNSRGKYSDGDWYYCWACRLHFQKSSDGDYFLVFSQNFWSFCHIFSLHFFLKGLTISFYFFHPLFQEHNILPWSNYAGCEMFFFFWKITLNIDFSLSIDQTCSQENYFRKNKYLKMKKNTTLSYKNESINSTN